MNQIIGLAEKEKEAFEACWTALDQINNVNQFSTALFRRVVRKGAGGGGKWKTGAALIYQIRCAIVHAGEKDMIFESFPDGEEAIKAGTATCRARGVAAPRSLIILTRSRWEPTDREPTPA